MMAATTQFLGGLDEQRRALLGVMCGVAAETTQVGISVLPTDLGVVASLTAFENHLRPDARIALDLFWITTCIHVIGARAVAALASASGRTLTLEGRGVRRLRKAVEGVFMAPLADLDPDVL
jgi:hypothetical protein